MSLIQQSLTFVILLASLWTTQILASGNKAPEWKEDSDPILNNYEQTRIEGQDIKLACPAKGRPRPEMIWYKNDQVYLPNSDKIRLKHANVKFLELELSDTGNYTCVARNLEGSIEFTFILKVTEKKWPLQLNVSGNLTVNEGEDARFYCIVLNDKNANLQWMKNEPIDDMDVAGNVRAKQPIYLSSANESPGILIIHNVSMSDAGKYTCVTGNNLGSNYNHMFLTVIPRSTTTTTTTTTTTSTTSTTTTTTPSTTTIAYDPTISCSSRRAQVGDTFVRLECSLEGNVMREPSEVCEKITWLFDSTKTILKYNHKWTQPETHMVEMECQGGYDRVVATVILYQVSQQDFEEQIYIVYNDIERVQAPLIEITTTTMPSTTTMEPFNDRKKDKDRKKKKDKKKNKKDKKKDKKRKNKKKDKQREKDPFNTNDIDPYNVPYDPDYDNSNYDSYEEENDFNVKTNWYDTDVLNTNMYGGGSYDPYNNPVDSKVENNDVDDIDDDDDMDNDFSESNDTSAQNEAASGTSSSSGGISVWTVYIIVGAVAGGILLAGLVAIAIALCCQREEDPQYKSTSV